MQGGRFSFHGAKLAPLQLLRAWLQTCTSLAIGLGWRCARAPGVGLMRQDCRTQMPRLIPNPQHDLMHAARGAMPKKTKAASYLTRTRFFARPGSDWASAVAAAAFDRLLPGSWPCCLTPPPSSLTQARTALIDSTKEDPK